jgi:hypothetical protein
MLVHIEKVVKENSSIFKSQFSKDLSLEGTILALDLSGFRKET